ncbi:MAG: pantoate--beta-alanine ligase, partial [Verrucomicrobiae bacterium]|nr:pantoate--beta-alanine ligase [Verrucomicrobiae bacterium]
SIQECRRAVSGGPVAASALTRRVADRIARCPDARLDYVAFFDGDTLEPAARPGCGTHMALAVFLGRTRLIDNGVL